MSIVFRFHETTVTRQAHYTMMAPRSLISLMGHTVHNIACAKEDYYYSPKAWFSSAAAFCTLDVMSLSPFKRFVPSTFVKEDPVLVSMAARWCR